MSARKGWEGAVRVGTTIADAEGSGTDEVGVQSVSYNFGNNVEELFHLGARLAQQLKEGLINITLDITSHYQSTDATNWSAKAGVGSSGALTEYYIGIYLNGATATEPEIRLFGKFQDYDVGVGGPDSVAIETMSFVASAIVVGAAFIG